MALLKQTPQEIPALSKHYPKMSWVFPIPISRPTQELLQSSSILMQPDMKIRIAAAEELTYRDVELFQALFGALTGRVCVGDGEWLGLQETRTTRGSISQCWQVAAGY